MSAQGSALLDGAEAVYQENQENIPLRLRGANKSRVENQENVNANRTATRTVLGALANKPRRQPAVRGSKQVRVVRVVFQTAPRLLCSALTRLHALFCVVY